MKTQTSILLISLRQLFNFSTPKKPIATQKLTYLELLKKEDIEEGWDNSIYKISSTGYFSDFFNVLYNGLKLGSKIIFSSEEEVEKVCEQKLPYWLKNKNVTNLFFCKIDNKKPITYDNVMVIIEDIRNKQLLLRQRSLLEEEPIPWEYDKDHVAFILSPQ